MIKQLINIIWKNGGGTIKNNKLVDFKEGYIVAIKEFEKIINTDGGVNDCIEELEEYINKHNDAYIGFWLNDGQLYLDVVKHINNYHIAMLEGFKQNQKAIWDCEECKEIWLG